MAWLVSDTSTHSSMQIPVSLQYCHLGAGRSFLVWSTTPWRRGRQLAMWPSWTTLRLNRQWHQSHRNRPRKGLVNLRQWKQKWTEATRSTTVSATRLATKSQQRRQWKVMTMFRSQGFWWFPAWVVMDIQFCVAVHASALPRGAARWEMPATIATWANIFSSRPWTSVSDFKCERWTLWLWQNPSCSDLSFFPLIFDDFWAMTIGSASNYDIGLHWRIILLWCLSACLLEETSELLAVFLPHIRCSVRIAAVPAAEIVEMIEEEIGPGIRGSCGDRLLDQTLRQMSLSALLAFITGRDGDFAASLRERVETLRLSLAWSLGTGQCWVDAEKRDHWSSRFRFAKITAEQWCSGKV